MPTLPLTNTDVDNADAATAAGAHRVDLVNSAIKQLILDIAARQASSTILTALAGLSPSADTVGYFTGSSAMATTALTPFGRSLTGAAGLAALQGILGSGTPSSTTFLRGDGTWAVPAGGGGGGIADAPNDANYYLRHALAWSAAATVARTGAYSDLSGLPTLGALASQASVNLASQATGNLPVANLAGGSGATSSTFWRGDGTWAVPAGGGGGVAGGLVTQTVANGAAVSWPLATEGATLVVDVQGSGANAALTALVQVRTGATLQCWVDDEFAEALWLWRADGTTPTGATQGNDSTGTLVSASGKVLVAAVSGAIVIQNNLGQSRDITVKGLPSGTGSGSFPDPGSSGLLARTALNVATPRTIVDAGSGRVTVTNGGGAAGNPTLDVAESALNLANIGGNLPVSKLASGTGASSTTFWRGDGTWATPSGGGGGSVTSVFGRTGAVVGLSGDYAAALVTETRSATNYTAAAGTVEGHLAGVDTALGRLGASAFINVGTLCAAAGLAVGQPGVNYTSVLQQAATQLAAGRSVFLPAGQWEYDNPLVLQGSWLTMTEGAAWTGEGKQSTWLVPRDNTKDAIRVQGLVTSSTGKQPVRVHLRSFGIRFVGDSAVGGGNRSSVALLTGYNALAASDGGRGIYGSVSDRCEGIVYRDLEIWSPGPGIRLEDEYDALFDGVKSSSKNDDSFQMQGGNTTTFRGCYAASGSDPGTCGYRVNDTALFLATTGLDGHDYWAIVGAINPFKPNSITSSTATTIQVSNAGLDASGVATAAPLLDQWRGQEIIARKSGQPDQIRRITTHTAASLYTINRAWTTNPDNTWTVWIRSPIATLFGSSQEPDTYWKKVPMCTFIQCDFEFPNYCGVASPFGGSLTFLDCRWFATRTPTYFLRLGAANGGYCNITGGQFSGSTSGAQPIAADGTPNIRGRFAPSSSYQNLSTAASVSFTNDSGA